MVFHSKMLIGSSAANRKEVETVSFMDVEMAKECMEAHKKAFESWEEGGIAKVWRDEAGILCVEYDSGRWWHYRETDSGSFEWW